MYRTPLLEESDAIDTYYEEQLITMVTDNASRDVLLDNAEDKSYKQLNGHAHDSKTILLAKKSSSILNISTFEDQKDKESYSSVTKPEKVSRLPEKLIYLLTTINIGLLAVGMSDHQNIIVYHYVVVMPCLVMYRSFNYSQIKQQYYLIDFCYYGNVLVMVFMLTLTNNYTWFFETIYAITTGPMLWAVLLFRNSLVPHDLDRITSIYIHVIPAFVTYCLRWYLPLVSKSWLYEIHIEFNVEVLHMARYLLLHGLVAFTIHVIIYTLLVYVLLRPGPEYMNSFRYLAAKNDGCVSKLVGLMGPRFQFPMYMMWQVVYCCLSLFAACLCYRYKPINQTMLALVFTAVIWNGACYHVEVFSRRGFRRVADDIILDVYAESDARSSTTTTASPPNTTNTSAVRAASK